MGTYVMDKCIYVHNVKAIYTHTHILVDIGMNMYINNIHSVIIIM